MVVVGEAATVINTLLDTEQLVVASVPVTV
jgi:hypothetical protein